MADPTKRRRVCLDCGTPKMPHRDKCIPCKKITLTHIGEARKSICQQCKFIVRYDGGSFDCGWARKNNPHVMHRAIDTMLDLGVDYAYACPDFRSSRYFKPSPNPLSFSEQEDIRAYLTLGAFWLDPYLWEGVDPNKDDVWEKQAEREAARDGKTTKVLTLAVAATATVWLANALFKPSSTPVSEAV